MTEEDAIAWAVGDVNMEGGGDQVNRVLETLSIDAANGVCILNGVDISEETSELHLDFEKGEWSLTVSRTTVYTTNDHESME